MTLQIGTNNGDILAVALTNNTAATLAVDTNNITTQATASAAITALDASINTVSTNRSNLGAMQNRLNSVTRSLAVASENTAAANSRIADADIASSMSELVRSRQASPSSHRRNRHHPWCSSCSSNSFLIDCGAGGRAIPSHQPHNGSTPSWLDPITG
ncbi:MAG: hypothetical protein DWI69_10900 [Chloroflexi bacterium]|nr:MAG: hypothetical protein DWI69_10900 [Chloroflexota bacterium]